MGLFVAFNTSETSVPVDSAGHVIEPHSWGVVDDLDSVAQAALIAGDLLRTDLSTVREGESNPAVIIAKKELEERLRLTKSVPTAKRTAAASTAEEK